MRYVNNANGRMPVILRSDDEAAGSVRAVRCAIAALLKPCIGQELPANPCGATSCTKSLPIRAYSYPLRRAQQKEMSEDFLFAAAAGSYFLLIRFAACVAS